MWALKHKEGCVMDLKITDLTQEQYNKIMDFSKTVVERKYKLSIWKDDCIDWKNEIELVFDTPEIEDVKILNCLKDYHLCRKYEVKKEKMWCF